MSFVYIAAHPKQSALTYQVESTLRGLGATTWVKDNAIDWESGTRFAALRNILFSSALLIFIDLPDDLDPPNFLGEIIEAKRSEKPFFIIRSEQEFQVLLPQLRHYVPRHSALLPMPLTEFEAPKPKLPPVHVHPDWLEGTLAAILAMLVIFILLRL